MKKKLTGSTGRGSVLGAAMVALSFGCAEPQQASAPPAPAAAPVETTTVERLPVSLNTVMVAMVNQAADPIWVAAWHNPESDADWRELERRAVQLELAGTLLSVPGTGPLDDSWTDNPDWQNWATQLRGVGADAVTAVQARDIEQISAVGDQIVEICEGCHIDFKLPIPTGGEFGELSPTAADFEEN